MNRKLELEIIFENNDFLVLNKPAGIIVHPTKYEQKKTLIQALLKYLPSISKVGEPSRPGIVHRLDKDVSGLMVVAKNNYFYNYLVSEFKKRKVKKKYIALVYGHPKEKKGIVETSIGWSKKGKIVAREIAIKLKKKARTEYKVKKEYKDFTLLEVSPLSGRTHQIRVHMAYLGTPIVGDKIYKFKNHPLLLNRLFLHCAYIGFWQPDGKFREFYSPLPSELETFLKKMK